MFTVIAQIYMSNIQMQILIVSLDKTDVSLTLRYLHDKVHHTKTTLELEMVQIPIPPLSKSPNMTKKRP